MPIEDAGPVLAASAIGSMATGATRIQLGGAH